jgi:hypothetical protein
VSDLFIHDWKAEVALESSWETQIEQAQDSLAEERTAQVERPYRSLRLRWTGVKRNEAARLLNGLLALAHRDREIPLYCDQSVVTAASSGTTIHCDTANRRFQAGKRVAIHEIGTDGRPTNPQYREVSVVGGASLTITAGLTGSFPAGSLVYPSILVDKVLDSQINYITDHIAEVVIDVHETYEDSALNPFNAAPADPAGWSTFGDYPILDDRYRHDWSSGARVGIARDGDRFKLGKGYVTTLRGERPQIELDLSFVATTRAAAWAILDFHDSRRGRLFPFWVAFTAGVWDLVTLDTGFVDIAADGTLADVQDFFTHIAVVLKSGTVHVREVTGVAVNGSDWRITLATSLPALSAANVARVVPAIFARFKSDAIEEVWVTDTLCRISLTVREVLAESTVEITEDAA